MRGVEGGLLGEHRSWAYSLGPGDFPGGPSVKTSPLSAELWVQSLVRELRFYVAHSQKTTT